MWRYLKQVLIAFDQLVNALLGGWADEDQPRGKSGFWVKRVYRGEKLVCWHLYVIRQWSLLPSKCLRISMGWKLFSFDGLKEETHQLTCYCNPLKTFKQ